MLVVYWKTGGEGSGSRVRGDWEVMQQERELMTMAMQRERAVGREMRGCGVVQRARNGHEGICESKKGKERVRVISQRTNEDGKVENESEGVCVLARR